VTTAIDTPALAEERFLSDLRARVAWQAEEAARQRAAVAPPEIDVRDLAALHRLVADHPRAARHAEWRAFLGELETLTDSDGRLPATLERLVRVVLAELLPR
jgi:hypothetical protein